MGNIKNIEGQRFGRLVPIEITGTAPSGHKIWKCLCDCGSIFYATGNAMKRGNTLSCGCLRNYTTKVQSIKHGHMSGRKISPTYRSWITMKTRCDNPNMKYYYNYGGRGISYCKRWKSFENFLEDMGNRPEGTSLDRINNDGNYEASNCRWATRNEQNKNRRKSCAVDAAIRENTTSP